VDPAKIRPDASEVVALRSNPDRARTLLGWSPAVALREGLSQTAAWYRANLKRVMSEPFHV
jgi:nucleoside-diphosphate-sugar epimerase